MPVRDRSGMVKRCARCGELNPRRSFTPARDWVDYLVGEVGAEAPVGTMVVPLCDEDHAAARELPETVDDDVAAFLDDVDPAYLVDEVAG